MPQERMSSRHIIAMFCYVIIRGKVIPGNVQAVGQALFIKNKLGDECYTSIKLGVLGVGLFCFI